MPSKALQYTIGGVLAVLLLCFVFTAGVLVGWAVPKPAVFATGIPSAVEVFDPQPESAATAVPGMAATTPQSPTRPQATDLDSLFKPFWQAWEIVHDQFVDQPVDDLKLMRGAISGMLEALGDKHTSYMDPEQFEQQSRSLQGEYEGIGAWVDTTLDFVTIINPMPDSPAEKAGLKTGDEVIAVDGEDMTGIDGSLVLQRILGPAGTSVTLTIRRQDVEPFDVTIERAKIEVPSVEAEDVGDGIFHIQLYTYGDNTAEELQDALRDVMRQNPKGLILDLRDNGGGYLNTAIEVVSEFIPRGVVMYEEYGDGTRRTFDAIRGGLATDVPLVVLVNGGTASASEITAGAIQDYGRGQLVGVKTYGKGSVQNWIDLDDNAGAVRVTIARWLTPKERQINDVGLEPDVIVERTEEDIAADRDPQLQKAIEILKNAQ
ncbi:MAG TPA: S41 family peptidase [Anaerolineaceae bacterium]